MPVIYLFYPETKGLELEEVDRLFATGETGLALSETRGGGEEEKARVVHSEVSV